MSSFGETNVNNYNLDSMDNAHDNKSLSIPSFFQFRPRKDLSRGGS